MATTRKRKTQISLTVPQELLDGADAMAQRIGLSRAAFINAAIAQVLVNGLSVAGSEQPPAPVSSMEG